MLNSTQAKDCAVYLVMALAGRTRTAAAGAKAVNELVNVADFFRTQVAPDIQSTDANLVRTPASASTFDGYPALCALFKPHASVCACLQDSSQMTADSSYVCYSLLPLLNVSCRRCAAAGAAGGRAEVHDDVPGPNPQGRRAGGLPGHRGAVGLRVQRGALPGRNVHRPAPGHEGGMLRLSWTVECATQMTNSTLTIFDARHIYPIPMEI